MNNTQEYLNQLLSRDKWTNEEKEWMLNYLDKADLTELETVAAESYFADVDAPAENIDRKRSAGILDKIHHRIDAPRPSFMERVRMHKMAIAAAAMVILIAGAGYFLFRMYHHGAAGDRTLAHTGRDGGAFPAADAHMHQVVTALSERKTVQLPDGTLVSMEQGTTLNYPDHFSDKARDIYLEGEAFFEVTPDAKHPFVVHTALIKTTVLGTSFNVESYPAAGEAHVVVVTGKVRVEVAAADKVQQEVVLMPNERAVYYEKPDRLVKEENAAKDANFCLQRRNGRFSYPGVAVAKVVEDVQRYYHIKLDLEGDVRNCIFHGHFHTSDDLTRVLKFIAIPLNATIRQDSTANRYVISGGGCQ